MLRRLLQILVSGKVGNQDFSSKVFLHQRCVTIRVRVISHGNLLKEQQQLFYGGYQSPVTSQDPNQCFACRRELRVGKKSEGPPLGLLSHSQGHL